PPTHYSYVHPLSSVPPDHPHLHSFPTRRSSDLHLELHQLQELLVIDHVRLVQKHHDVGHPHLAGQQNVLARLRHRPIGRAHHQEDRKSTRLNSSHLGISYAVFCLKKKKRNNQGL